MDALPPQPAAPRLLRMIAAYPWYDIVNKHVTELPLDPEAPVDILARIAAKLDDDRKNGNLDDGYRVPYNVIIQDVQDGGAAKKKKRNTKKRNTKKRNTKTTKRNTKRRNTKKNVKKCS